MSSYKPVFISNFRENFTKTDGFTVSCCKFFVDDDADNAWSNFNDWSYTDGGAGGDGKPTFLDNIILIDTSSPDDVNLSENSEGRSLVSTGYTGSFNMLTHNLDLGSNFTWAGGTFIQGVNSTLEANGIIFSNSTVYTGDITSLLITHGDFIIGTSVTFSAVNKGILHIKGDGDCGNNNLVNPLYSYKLFEGVTINLVNDFRNVGIGGGDWESDGIVINNGFNYFISGGTNSNITIGVNSDIVGTSGHMWCTLLTTQTIQNLKTSAFSYTGQWTFNLSANPTATCFTGNFGTAKIRFWKSTNNSAVMTPQAGTIIGGILEVGSNSTSDMNIDNSVNNTSYELSGNIDLNGDVGVFTTNWTKGTSTITLNGSTAQTIEYDGQSVESQILIGAGEKQFQSSFTTVDFSGDADISAPIPILITISGADTWTGTDTGSNVRTTAIVLAAITGNWSTPATWTNGKVPGDNDKVTIDGYTVTLTQAQQAGELTITPGSTVTGAFELTIDDSVLNNKVTIITNGGTISVDSLLLVPTAGAGSTQATLTLESDFTIRQSNALVKMLGNLNIGSNDLYIKGKTSNLEATSMRLDMNNHPLTCGAITIGESGVGGLGIAKLIGGNGSHTISGLFSGVDSTTHGYIDAETASWTFENNIDFTDLTWNVGTEVITLDPGDATVRTIDFSGQTIYDLSLLNGDKVFSSGFTCNDFSGDADISAPVAITITITGSNTWTGTDTSGNITFA